MVTLFLEKEENNINVMAVALFLNIGNTGKIENIFFKIKFIYSEKATTFCEIFPLLLTTVHTVKSKGKISQNFVAFSEYMNFKYLVFWQYCTKSGHSAVQ